MTYHCVFLEKRSPNMAYSRIFITRGYSSQPFVFTTHKLRSIAAFLWRNAAIDPILAAFLYKNAAQGPDLWFSCSHVLKNAAVGNKFFFSSSIHIPAQHITCNSCLVQNKTSSQPIGTNKTNFQCSTIPNQYNCQQINKTSSLPKD